MFLTAVKFKNLMKWAMIFELHWSNQMKIIMTLKSFCLRCGMLEMWDVWDVDCSRRGMLSMWDVQHVDDVGRWGSEMFKIWDIWDVG